MSKAEKLLERMRRTKDGWGQDDFRTLYTGYGFTVISGGNHQKYVHEEYRLIATVGWHDTLATGYAVDAVKNIDKLLALQERDREEAVKDEAE